MKKSYKFIVNNIIAVFLILFLFSINSCSVFNSSTNNKPRIILGKVDFRGDSTTLNYQKFDAAFSLANRISKKYDYIGLTQIQELISKEPKYKNYVMSDIAEDINADYIINVQVNILKHIMRTQISLNPTNTSNQAKSGFGYDVVHYIDAQTGDFIYDTALLKSLKRAISVVERDSTLFVIDSLGLNVKPLPTLVIGSIAFEDNSGPEWVLFKDKVISSYAGVEAIYDHIKNSQNYVVYDTETRDTVYKMFGFHIVENYNAPTSHELKVLYQLGIDYYVAGTVKKNDSNADLTIGLYNLKNGFIEEIKTEKESFVDDSRMVFLEHVSRATKRLFNLK